MVFFSVDSRERWDYEIGMSTGLHQEIEVSDGDCYIVSDFLEKLTAATLRKIYSS
jgi:hypothetical protein